MTQPLVYVDTSAEIHIQTALTIGAGGVLTYDKRMAEAAEYFGMEVHSPA